MKERPILFSGPMVSAILGGRKWQTRRAVKPQPRFTDPQHQSVDPPHGGNEWTWWAGNVTQGIYHEARCPYGKPGDRLWVREAFSPCVCQSCRAAWPKPGPHIVTFREGFHGPSGVVFRSPIHMPRWASRIDLEITGIRVERLQDISEADAAAEGVTREDSDVGRIYWHDSRSDWSKDPRHAYEQLWQSINGPQSWEANPWVWVIEFKRKDKQ